MEKHLEVLFFSRKRNLSSVVLGGDFLLLISIQVSKERKARHAENLIPPCDTLRYLSVSRHFALALQSNPWFEVAVNYNYSFLPLEQFLCCQ